MTSELPAVLLGSIGSVEAIGAFGKRVGGVRLANTHLEIHLRQRAAIKRWGRHLTDLHSRPY
jgi:hypothetical protein